MWPERATDVGVIWVMGRYPHIRTTLAFNQARDLVARLTDQEKIVLYPSFLSALSQDQQYRASFEATMRLGGVEAGVQFIREAPLPEGFSGQVLARW